MALEKIGRFSRSLLGLLDMTSQGNGPELLNLEVRPMIDLVPFVGANVCKVLSKIWTVPVGTEVQSQTHTLAAPFMVLGVSGSLDLFDTGDYGRVRIAMNGFPAHPESDAPTGTKLYRLALSDAVTMIATAGGMHVIAQQWFSQPFLLLPGMGFTIGGYNMNITATPSNLTLQVVGYDLRTS
jgi:hypothetical protein